MEGGRSTVVHVLMYVHSRSSIFPTHPFHPIFDFPSAFDNRTLSTTEPTV